MDEKQQGAVLDQVVDHIKTLPELRNDKMVSAEGLRVYGPYLSLRDLYETFQPFEMLRMSDLDTNKSKAYEEMWLAESDKPFSFYHADLGPTNIKVKVEMGKAKVTEILDWEIAGYLPIGWVCTKPLVASGLDFAWNGEREEHEWRRKLAVSVINEGFPKIPRNIYGTVAGEIRCMGSEVR